jgi:serine/threonine-protein kinase
MKLVAPRAPTPVISDGRAASHLPTDVVTDQVQRLRLFALIAGGMWLIGLLLDVFVYPGVLAVGGTRATILVNLSGIATALAVYLYARFAPRSAQNRADAGLWLMVLNAFEVTLLETWARGRIDLKPGQVSWIVVVILLSAMIMPSTPRKMTAATLIAASMGPLGIWLSQLGGMVVPSPYATFLMYLPNYTCALAGVMPSIIFQRIGRRLREARELGSYELLEPLGEGGMGEVWRARHRLLAREAAIKLVRPEVLGASSDEQARLLLRRFEREAQATAQLSSAHTIRLFDFGTTEDGSFYYAMELLTGRDLESFVKEFGPIPADRTMFLLRQMCHSLAEAHAFGLTHRDVKPANIYVCRMGLDYDFIKVLDFGLVKLDEAQDAEARTHSLTTAPHTTIGTPAYMAPEVILGHAAVDRRADVYALGCVAYFMLTGQRVFEGRTPMEALVNHVHTAPVPPSARTELRVPPDLDAIVLACLEKDPDKRPQDAMALRRLLHECSACDGWSNRRARAWWQVHLPELAGPLTFVDEPVTGVQSA